MAMPAPVTEPDIREEQRAVSHRLWRTVVHDDPINTMNYVTWVFHSYGRL